MGLRVELEKYQRHAKHYERHYDAVCDLYALYAKHDDHPARYRHHKPERGDSGHGAEHELAARKHGYEGYPRRKEYAKVYKFSVWNKLQLARK